MKSYHGIFSQLRGYQPGVRCEGIRIGPDWHSGVETTPDLDDMPCAKMVRQPRVGGISVAGVVRLQRFLQFLRVKTGVLAQNVLMFISPPSLEAVRIKY